MRANLLLASLFALVSCAGAQAPETAGTTAALAPEQWQAATGADTADPAGAGVDAMWWQGFEDPRLDRLIEIALESNRDLRSAAARLDAAFAQARIAGAQLKPQAGLSVNGNRSRQNFIGLPIPGAEGGVLSNTSTSIGAVLNVSWEVDLWGRVRAGRDAAESRAEAALFDLAGAGLSVSGQVAKAWFAFLESASQVDLAAETLDNRRRVRERIERRYRSGLRTALELRLAISNEENSAAVLAGRERLHDLTRRQLEALLAREPSALALLDEVESGTAELPDLPRPPMPDLPIDALRRRPDLRASESRLAAAGLDVAAARRMLYPQLTLTGSTGRSSNQLEDLVESDFSIWSVAAGILQPLFQGGRLRAGVDLAKAGRRDLLARHEGAVIRAITDVEGQLAADGLLASQYAATKAATEAATAARDLAENRYFAGLSDYLAVLAAEASATTAASQLLDIERQRLGQRVDLYLALGGGLPLPPSTEDNPGDPGRAVADLAEPAEDTEDLK
ncbi:MAG: efflux transporter outer membrane subunit [Thermoanaerobaculia bacterium]